MIQERHVDDLAQLANLMPLEMVQNKKTSRTEL